MLRKLWVLAPSLFLLAFGSPGLASPPAGSGPPAGFTNILMPAINNSGAASANTSLIQAALNNAGSIRIACPTSGAVWINATLVAKSHTLLSADPSCQIEATTNTGNLLVNAAYLTSWTSTGVSLAWTSGLTATLTYPNHGLSKGDPVWVRGTSGTTDHAYFGVFSVQSVSDANTVVINLRTMPGAAPSGTIQVKKADTDITLEGGTWDYNYSGGNTGSGSALHAIVLGAVRNVTVRNIVGIDAGKYILCLGGVQSAWVENVEVHNTNSDGIKLYAPMFDATVANLRGDTGDDVLSAQTEEPVAFAAYDFTGGGDVLGLHVTDVTGNPGGSTSVVAIYSTNPAFEQDDVTLDRISGYAANAFIVKVDGINVAGPIRNLKVSNLEIKGLTGSLTGLEVLNGGNVDNLTIDGLSVSPNLSSATVIPVVLFNFGTVQRLNISRVDAGFSNANYALVVVNGTGTVGNLTVDGGYESGTTSNGTLVYLQGASNTVKKVLVTNFYFGGIHQVVQTANGSTPVIELRGNHGTVQQGVNATANATIKLTNNDFGSTTNGLIRLNNASGVWSVYSGGGNTLSSGSMEALINGTEAVTLYGAFAGEDALRTVTSGASDSVTLADAVVVVNKGAGSATTENLPANPPKGFHVVIKDGKGDAATNNITVTPAAGTIDGAANAVINTNYGSVSLRYNGSAWSVSP